MEKVRCGNDSDDTLHENEQEGVSTPVIETSITQNNELLTLGVMLAAKIETSLNFKPKLECAGLDETTVCKTEKEATPDISKSYTDTLQNTIEFVKFTNIQEFPSSSISKTSNIKHYGPMLDENELEKEEISKIVPSIVTNSLNANVRNTKDIDVTVCRNSIKNILDEPQESTVNSKSESQCQMNFGKPTVAELLHPSQSLERNSIEPKTNTHDTLMKESNKKKEEISATRIVSDVKNKLDKCNSNDKEIVGSNLTNKTKNAQKIEQSLVKSRFLTHIPVQEMKEILKAQTSDNIQYIKGILRVNSKFNNYAHLSMEDGGRDLLINGIIDRNRAFDGDLVVAHINPKENWHTLANGDIQRTGTVVCILKELHSRKITGHLLDCSKKVQYVIIKPKDQRIPLVRIYSKSLPPSYHRNPDNYKNVIIFVRIYNWPHPHYALGKFLWTVGNIGDVNAELQSIILDNNLDVSPYCPKLLQELPNNDILMDTDIKDREDWREECIFTIDPATANDLDDAVSCKVLNNGNYEIGVHISDVTHYLKFFSPLDYEISKRATTVYLPHTCYHMLPEQLCRLCSLLPGKDRLAFSVIWEMTPNAEIVKYRFAKTVIRSCCRMSYESAQIMIGNPEVPLSEDIVDIKGDYTTSLLSDVVNNLFKLSVILREKRYDNGALRLDQPKIEIYVDPMIFEKHGVPVPINYSLKQYKDSNRLIEEFMLLANMTVAAHLYDKIPETALLRVHRDPIKHSLIGIRDILQNYGIHLNIETPGDLYSSIQRYEQNLQYDSNIINDSMKYIMMVIINMCSKTMVRAEYKCASTVPLVSDLKHYALNVPLYTHFTSPIRRYSDCIVHRLLHATIMNKPMPKIWTTSLCSRIANNCNLKKNSAKIVQEQSTELLFIYMVGLAGGFNAVAIVLDVKESGMDVILCDIGIKLRVNFKDLKPTTATVEYSTEYLIPTITVRWKTPAFTQKINIFSLVKVRVEKSDKEFHLKVFLQQ